MNNETRTSNMSLVEEALRAIREKDVRSTTLERLRITHEADAAVRGLPQPRQLGEGLHYILERISLPVSPHDLILGRISEEVPDAEGEAFFQGVVKEWKRGIPPWMLDGGHECFAWERVMSLGLGGLEDFARKERDRCAKAGVPQATLDWLDGAIRVYEAFRLYARRYGQAAREAGLEGSARRCEAIADHPPKTFAEALQLIWLITHVYCTMLSQNPTLTMGRADQLLLGLYRDDLAAERLTRGEAAAIIDDFYAKNNIILGRGEHQMSGGSPKATGWARNLTYDAPQYLFLGGRRADGSAPVNELTELFIERIMPAYENPVIILRYTEDFPESAWRLACEKLRANASILVYNDEVVIPAYRAAGLSEQEAVEWSLYGCNWPITNGRSRTVIHRRPFLPEHFLKAFLADGAIETMDDLYGRFAQHIRAEATALCEEYRKWERDCDGRAPGPLRVDDCFLNGPIARARSWQVGGMPLSTITVGFLGTATAADCFAAVDHLVFESPRASVEELRKAVREDFAGREDLRQLCLHAPKFGAGDERADRHAARMMNIVLDEFDRAAGHGRPFGHAQGKPGGICILKSTTTDMTQKSFGAKLGATPDGRRAGQPISENTSPTPGACKNGITAMFRSLARLPFRRLHSGALNVRIQPRLVKGERGLANLAALLRSYFEMGGMQVQLSFVSADDLREAQAHPEAHRDLMIRITGYSAVFVDMSGDAQAEIIRREEMDE